jgi:diguanylate cyclase (GGDEF)-like protein
MISAELIDAYGRDVDLFENIEIKDLLNSLEGGAIVADKEGSLIFYNNNAPIILKTDLEEFLNNNIKNIYYFQNLLKGEAIPAHIKELASGYKVSNIYKIDEKTHYFENERIDLYDDSGKVKGRLHLIKDITKEIQLEISLTNDVKLDGLSGLYNSKFFYEEIEKEIARCSRYGHDLSILFIDIDNFKIFNDTLGHKAGDEIIKFTAESLKNAVRKNVDSTYRYGGDEFMVLLPNTPALRSIIVANRILSLFDNGFKEKLKTLILSENNDFNLDNFAYERNKSKKIGLSIGITEYRHGKSANELINEADAAMYKAKKEEGTPFRIFHEDLC